MDDAASDCESRRTKNIVWKQQLATQTMFSFMSLWSQQFLPLKPVDSPHGAETLDCGPVNFATSANAYAAYVDGPRWGVDGTECNVAGASGSRSDASGTRRAAARVHASRADSCRYSAGSASTSSTALHTVDRDRPPGVAAASDASARARTAPSRWQASSGVAPDATPFPGANPRSPARSDVRFWSRRRRHTFAAFAPGFIGEMKW